MKNIIRKSSLLVACISLLFIASCDKESDLPPGSTCFLKSFSSASDDSGYTLEFTFASDGKLSGFKATFIQVGQGNFVTTVTVTYDGSGRISQLDLSDGSWYEYTYNANGKLASEDSYEDDKLYSRAEYVYNSSGQLIREDIYYPQSSGLDDAYTENYEYANTGGSNPIRSTYKDPSGTSYGYVEYEYDDKPTPYSQLNLPLGVNDGAGAAINNVTKRTSKSNSGTVESTTVNTYQYNVNGYPTSVSQTMSFPGSANTYTNNETYTYDCK